MTKRTRTRTNLLMELERCACDYKWKILGVGICNLLPFFFLSIRVSYAFTDGLTYGKWTEALRFPETYENGIGPDGRKYFACQGRRLDVFDPLKNWWQHRCFDDIREEPRKPRVCNSTATCCYKFCVLQRLDWLSPELKYDKRKAHAFVKNEYGDKKYPMDIIDDLIDEFDICADWYEERDTMDCSKNSAFVKCQTQVFINVCDRLPTNMNSLPDLSVLPEQSPRHTEHTLPLQTKASAYTGETKAGTLARDDDEDDPFGLGHSVKPSEKTNSYHPSPTKSQTTRTVRPVNGTGGKAHSISRSRSSIAVHRSVPDQSAHREEIEKSPTICVDKCKGLCLAHTKFEP